VLRAIAVPTARVRQIILAAALLATSVVAPAGVVHGASIAETQKLIAALSEKLAHQEQLSESLAEKYNAAKQAIRDIDGTLARLTVQIAQKKSALSRTSASLVDATVHAYVLGAADAQWLDLFRQDTLNADARNQYETLVLGNLRDLKVQLKSQQEALNQTLAARRHQRALKANEASKMQTLLAQNARNEAATRATLATVTKKLKRQIINYQISVAKAASKRHDDQAVARAVAAAAAVGGQAAANEVLAAIKPKPHVGGTGATSSAGMRALRAAMSVRGLPYVWGGESPKYGFDCSGLTQWSWARAGYYIPRTAAMQYYATKRVPLNKLQPGDLLFYYNLDNDHQIDHVVMYAGQGPWGLNTIISAAHRGTVISFSPLFTYGLYGAGRPKG
jgi:cell wall-associated NlpC family hydrolase